MKDYIVNGKVVDITLENGKVVKASTVYLENLVKSLNISFDDAVYTWLEDEGYETNEEQEELVKKAKDNKITASIHKAEGKTREKRKVERKPNPDKESLIATMAEFLTSLEEVDGVEVTNVGKLIEFNFRGKAMKIDLVEKRVKKD